MIGTREDLLNYLEEKTKLMVETARKKNQDYAGAGTDPFQNFTRVESLGICKTEVGFLTRMTDKLCRIASFVAAGTLQVKDESVQDTLLDLANYALLMSAYIESRKGKPDPLGNVVGTYLNKNVIDYACAHCGEPGSAHANGLMAGIGRGSCPDKTKPTGFCSIAYQPLVKT